MRCPHREIFFGGARGGGKTDGVLGRWLIKALTHGERFYAVGFRRKAVDFEDTLARARQLYRPVGASYNGTEKRFEFPSGARISFGYLDRREDAEGFQGANITEAWIEEVGQYASPDVIWLLYGALRSPHGLATSLILTGNPGGAGQHWIAERYGLIPFPDGPRVIARDLPNGATHQVAVIPSRVTDNPYLGQDYVDGLHLVGGPRLVRAWLTGDWSAVEGAFFEEWDPQRHVVEPFGIPEHWLRFRSMDWGFAAPFSVGWWAVAGDDRGPIPRGALVRYREWYGASAPGRGLRLTAEEIARGIIEREQMGETIAYGVCDPSMFSQDGGPSHAERMAKAGIVWRPADNARVGRLGHVGGWDQLRARLRGDLEGRPGLVVFSTCRDFVRTVPVLQHDPDKPEDLDTTAEDHVADEARYACMSRPYVAQAPKTDEKQWAVWATQRGMTIRPADIVRLQQQRAHDEV